MFGDSAIGDFEMFVVLSLGDFFEGISEQFEHGSDFDEAELVFFIELLE